MTETTRFPTQSGRGRLVPAGIIPPDELPDETFPMVSTTGRQLEHSYTGAMTRRDSVLDELEPQAVASLCPRDLSRLNIQPGSRIKVSTRRGAIELQARADSAVPSGMVFIPFCYAEAPANVLTNDALDPFWSDCRGQILRSAARGIDRCVSIRSRLSELLRGKRGSGCGNLRNHQQQSRSNAEVCILHTRTVEDLTTVPNGPA